MKIHSEKLEEIRERVKDMEYSDKREECLMNLAATHILDLEWKLQKANEEIKRLKK